MAHPYDKHRADKAGAAKAKVLTRADGGKVLAIPFSLNQTADALKRLNAAGINTKSRETREFTANRLRAAGRSNDEIQWMTGTQPKYKSGGKVELPTAGGRSGAGRLQKAALQRNKRT